MIRVEIPLLEEYVKDGQLVRNKRNILLDIDPSAYSEERWEQNFPNQAEHEGLFSYIERIQNTTTTERVRVAAMLKALYCFIESKELPNYKSFAQLFNFSDPEYTETLITKLTETFKLITGSSTVKN